MSVLLITSRKSKVLESIRKLGIHVCSTMSDSRNYEGLLFETPFDPETFQRIIFDEGGVLEISLYQRSVICTDAFIEAYLRNVHHPEYNSTYLWNRFDMIVWDEAHSLYTDSSFRSAPFHVASLLKRTLSLIEKAEHNASLPPDEQDPVIHPPTCRHIILMTGTPGLLTTLPWLRESHILDMRQTCINVSPANLHFLTSLKAQQLINEQIERGERIVYFSNHTVTPDELLLKYRIPREKTAVSFSKPEKRKALEDASSESDQEDDYRRMINVESYLAEHSHIRPDIQLFVTTSKNKEGINIEDKDIRHIYIESHSLTDIIQMAGRIRFGAEHAYIILDSKGFGGTEPTYERTFARLCALPEQTEDNPIASQLNRNLKEFCRQINISGFVGNAAVPMKAYNDTCPELGQFIDHIKNQSDYYQFDYIRNQFFYNVFRETSLDFVVDEWHRFNTAKQYGTLVSMFKEAFPETQIHPYLTPEEEGHAIVLRYLWQHPKIYHRHEEIVELALELQNILGAPKRKKGASFNPNYFLRQVGFEARRRNNNRMRSSYNEYTIHSYPEDDGIIAFAA